MRNTPKTQRNISTRLISTQPKLRSILLRCKMMKHYQGHGHDTLRGQVHTRWRTSQMIPSWGREIQNRIRRSSKKRSTRRNKSSENFWSWWVYQTKREVNHGTTVSRTSWKTPINQNSSSLKARDLRLRKSKREWLKKNKRTKMAIKRKLKMMKKAKRKMMKEKRRTKKTKLMISDYTLWTYPMRWSTKS